MKKRWLLLLPALITIGPLGWWVWKVNYTEYQARKTILEYQLPTGFTGWITIKHSVPDAGSVFVPDGIGGTYTYRIPAAGYLETSSPIVQTWHTNRYFRADRGGAVLVAWDPPPFFLRESSTDRCTFIYVPEKALPLDQDSPPLPEHGCH